MSRHKGTSKNIGSTQVFFLLLTVTIACQSSSHPPSVKRDAVVIDAGVASLAYNTDEASNLERLDWRLRNHPDKELGNALREYIQKGLIKPVFQTKAEELFVKREVNPNHSLVSMGPPENGSSAPRLNIETLLLMAEVNEEFAFRSIEHEGRHAMHIITGKFPVSLLGKKLTREDIKTLFEEEVKTFGEECEFAFQQSYRIPPGDDCYLYAQGLLPQWRVHIADNYSHAGAYQEHLDYLRALGADPNAR